MSHLHVKLSLPDFFLFYSFIVKMCVLLLEVDFLLYFFCLFSMHSYVFSNNLLFKICLYNNHFYVLFFQIFTFLKLYLVFSKLLKK